MSGFAEADTETGYTTKVDDLKSIPEMGNHGKSGQRGSATFSTLWNETPKCPNQKPYVLVGKAWSC